MTAETNKPNVKIESEEDLDLFMMVLSDIIFGSDDKVKCAGCKCEFDERYLTDYMGSKLCMFCLSFQTNVDHPEDNRRSELE